MSDDLFMKAVDKALKKAGAAAEYEYLFKKMCEYYLSLTEGDTHLVDDAYDLMREYGIVDEDGFAIESEE